LVTEKLFGGKMSYYYCHKCGIDLGLLTPVDPIANFTGSVDTLQKFYKHTVPPSSGSIISIFDQPDYENYKNYIVNTWASGSVELDDQGRINIVWFAGCQTGLTFNNGILQGSADGVKLVLHNNPARIHAYPTGSVEFVNRCCTWCGRLIAS
jgi:hypothetical protein